MWKGWIPGAVALVGIFAWLGQDETRAFRLCAVDRDCEPGEICALHRCEPLPPAGPIHLVLAAPQTGTASCGDGICDLAAGECAGICPEDCPEVPCSLPCTLDGHCREGEGAQCPDCFPAGCSFDGLCTVGESPRCPDCSCGDLFCDEGAGECVDTCPEDCPDTACARRCDFDAVCEEEESERCPDCTCGDGICEPELDDCRSCPLDCGPCEESCGDGICAEGEGPDCPDCIPAPCGAEESCTPP